MSAIVTLLFTDLVGSTELLQRLGDDRAEVLRRRHFRALRDAVASQGGQEVKNLGDGLMVVFDSVVDAMSCAVAMQQAVHRQNAREEEALGVRVGLNAGEPIRDEEDFFGTSVAVAKRLCDAAEGGQIIASEVVCGLVGSRGDFEMVSIGALELKGLSEPVPAREVRWAPVVAEQTPLPPPLESADRVGLVAREAELGQLADALKASLGGGVQLALVAGEPGIGKTRLTSEFARRAHDDGATVLLGRCEEEPLAAYQPIVEALGYYVASASVDDLRSTVGQHGPVLAALLPSLRERLPALAEAPTIDPESDRGRLFDAVAATVTSIADRGPCVLLLEDIHWAQAPMLKLLEHLRRTPTAHGFLVVGTYRESELARAHPLSDTLADLRRADEGVVRIGLRGLDVDGVLALLERASEVALPAEASALAAELHRTTEGNPFFVRELLRHLIESGAIEQRSGGWVVRPLHEIGIPEGVKEVVGRRLSRLSDDANTALRVAAVIGREFDLALLAAVTGDDEDDVLALLEEAVAARALEEARGVLDRFVFAHALVRETLLDETTVSRRVRLHRRIGEALEARHADDPGPVLAELAYHFGEAAEAGEFDRAVRYARLAAARARKQFAFEAAAGHLSLALETVEAAEPVDERLRCEVLIELAEAQDAFAGREVAKATATLAAGPARTIGDPVLFARVAAAYAGAYGRPGTADAPTVDLIREALDGLAGAPSVEKARLLARLANEYMTDPDNLERYAGQALEVARAVDDDAAIGAALWAGSFPASARMDPAEMLALAEEVRARGIAGRDRRLAAMSTWILLTSLLWRGELDRARAVFVEREAEVSEPFPDLDLAYLVRLWRAMFAMHDARFEECEALINDAFAFGQELGNTLVQNQYSAQLFGLRRAQGRLAEMEPLMLALSEVDPEIPWDLGLGLLYAEEGRLDEARIRFDQLMVSGVGGVKRDPNYGISLVLMADICWYLRDERHAPELYDALLPHSGLMCIVGLPCIVAGPFDQYLACLASVLGRHDEARSWFESAMALADGRAGSTVYAAWIRLHFGHAILDDPSGDRSEARALLEDALRRADEAGVAAVSRPARATLEELA